jgi:hypothetical protein
LLAGLGAAAVLVGVLVVQRHDVVRFALERLAGFATGYTVRIGNQHLGLTHGAVMDVRVSRHGEPVLSAKRIDVYYSPRELLPGSTHRFGITAIAIDAPNLTLIRHQDGSYNVASASGGGAASPGRADPIPLRLTARVRDGTATLIDRGNPAKPEVQTAYGIHANLALDSSARTHYVLGGAFAQNGKQPFSAVGTIDRTRGYAMHRLRASAVPMSTIANTLIHSPAARVLQGEARAVDVRAYAFDVAPDAPIDYHVGGGLTIADGQMYVDVLSRPLQHIAGRVGLVDGVVFSNDLSAQLGTVPVTARGAIFDFSDPQFRFGISGAGDLASLREDFAFSKNEPVRGRGTIGALIEGPVSNPIVVARAATKRAYYRDLPIDHLNADIAIALGHVFIAPMTASYGGVAGSVRGVLTMGRALRTQLLVHAVTDAAHLPYLDEMLPGEPVVADALFTGTGDLFGARGGLASLRGVRRMAALFSFAPDGATDIAPFWVNSEKGTFAGRYVAQRKNDTSAFWAAASGLHLTAPVQPVFPGLKMPRLPAIGGTLAHGEVVGGGSSSHDVVVAGRASAIGATIAGVPFNAVEAVFAGNLADASIGMLHADGPWGRFDGRGGFSTSRLAAVGDYAGDLRGVSPLIGDLPARGRVSGPIAISFADNRIVVQARGLQFAPGSRVHGVAVQRLTGTLAYEKGALRVYSAQLGVAGGTLIAAGPLSGSGLAMVGSGMHGQDLAGLGVPIDGGSVAVNGTVRDRGQPLPAFDGGVVVRGGRAAGYPVKGTAQLSLHGGSLVVRNAVAALGGAYAYVNGTVNGLASHDPQYALRARVPAADVPSTLAALRLPTYMTQGVFNGTLSIGGTGREPRVTGPIAVPGGAVNGLPFTGAHADLAAGGGTVSARHGSVRVGSTAVRFFARLEPTSSAFGVRSTRADLSDFDNFFDTGDTLDGEGSVSLVLAINDKRGSTRGDVRVNGLRYRSLFFGDTLAHWSSRSNDVTGTLAVAGKHGSLRASGTIGLSPSHEWQRVLARSNYNMVATIDDLDLSTWLPAIGYPDIPMLGKVDASARLEGAYPHLRVTGIGSLADGSFASMPIQTLSASVSSDGKDLQVRNAQLVASGIVATATGAFGFHADSPLALTVHASTDNLPMLISQLTKKTIDVRGTFESTMKIGGTFEKPTFGGAFDASNVTAYGVRVASLFGSVRLRGDSLELSDAGLTFAQGSVTLAGTLPLQLRPFGIGPPDSPVRFDLDVQGLDPGTFDAPIGANTKLGGRIDGHVGLAGTVRAPLIFGRIGITNGSYVSALDRVPVTATVATLTFDRNRATIDNFDAHFGSGDVNAKGTIAFEHGFGELGDVTYAIHAVAAGAQADLPTFGSGAVDGIVDLTRSPPGLAQLSGTATLTNAVIPFGAFLAAGSGAGGSGGGAPWNVGLKLTVAAGKNVRVRGGVVGAGLDIGATGSALLAGTLRAPTLDGRFQSTGGTLTYFDRAFNMQSGMVTFDPADGVVPNLKAVAVAHVLNPGLQGAPGNIDITVSVSGPLSNINLALSSSPPGYSRQQLLALLAPFGSLVALGNGQPDIGAAPSLPGAPVTPTGALPPGVLVSRGNGTVTVGQEAFSLLNAQFASGLLAPLENALGETGLGNVDLSLDYYGGVGVNVRRGIGRFLNAIYASSFGVVQRQSFGLEYAPSNATAAQLSFFFETGPQRLLDSSPIFSTTNYRATAGQAINGQSGFSFTLQRLFW